MSKPSGLRLSKVLYTAVRRESPHPSWKYFRMLASLASVEPVSNIHNLTHLQEALQTTKVMEEQGIPLHRDTIYYLLQNCTKKKDMESGRQVQYFMVHSGLDAITVLGDHLIRMFAICGNLYEANQAFSKTLKPTAYTWTAIISANNKLGQWQEALDLYYGMQTSSLKNSKYACIAVTTACASSEDLSQGRLIHEDIIKNGFENDVFIGNTLVDMYAKCNSLEEACRVFDNLQDRDVVSYNAMITGYALHGQGFPALILFERMQQEGIQPQQTTFLNVLKACSSIGAIEQGRLIHNQIISGDGFDIVIGNTLLDMYGKSGSIKEACLIFDTLPDRNVVSYAAMMAGYACHGHAIYALELFEKMEQEAVRPEKVTFLNMLIACGRLKESVRGRLIHQQLIESGLEHDIMICNALLDMYAKCGNIEAAYKQFDKLENKDVVSWGSIIAGCIQHGLAYFALDEFEKMQQYGIMPNEHIYSSILKACGSLGSVHMGRFIHEQLLQHGLKLCVIVLAALVDMYAKCGKVEEAQKVFVISQDRDALLWGTMIAGYACHGSGSCALELFEEMQCKGLKPNKVIFLSVLKACSSTGALYHGRLAHDQIIRSGLCDGAIGNSLIDMYAKSGNLKEARSLFDKIPERNVIAWSAMIAGYAQHGDGLAALSLFEKMQWEGIEPNKITFLGILSACGSMGAIDQGKGIHDQIKKRGLEHDVIIGNTLLDMYFKCNNVDEASKVFEMLPKKDVVSWASMIAGYAQCGDVNIARKYFVDMQMMGIRPDDVSFTNILSACSHAGLVLEGYQYLKSMIQDYGIVPSFNHYNSLIDLLGRAGCLAEAQSLLENIQQNVVGWTSLLTACRTYGNVAIGRQCFDQMIYLNVHDGAAYVLMANIYANAHMRHEAQAIEDTRKLVGAWKKPARTWIEVNGKVHEFVAGDQSHQQSGLIYGVLEKLNKRMIEEGYVPECSLVLGKMSEEEKKHALCGHAEKLAIAFGLASTPHGTTIRTTKNLRVCNDCHNATKFISKIERREIIIKDAYRIHHFQNGACSCGDYF